MNCCTYHRVTQIIYFKSQIKAGREKCKCLGFFPTQNKKSTAMKDNQLQDTEKLKFKVRATKWIMTHRLAK